MDRVGRLNATYKMAGTPPNKAVERFKRIIDDRVLACSEFKGGRAGQVGRAGDIYGSSPVVLRHGGCLRTIEAACSFDYLLTTAALCP